MASKKYSEKKDNESSQNTDNIPKSKQLIRMLSFRIVPTYYKKIEDIADHKKTTVSALIRKYIKNGMLKDLKNKGELGDFRIE